MSIAQLRRRLVELDAAVFEQKLVLDALQRDKAAVQSELDTISTYPVLTLPFEITAHIFTMCLPSIEELRREDERARMSDRLNSVAPTVFLGVCQAWRDIALATPVLWATLSICFDVIDDGVMEQLGEIEGYMERWLRRATLRPLSIIFHSTAPTQGPFEPSRLRDVIHRYAHQIEYLELHSKHDIRQLELDSVAFPLLRQAAIGDFFGVVPDAANFYEVFCNAPQLRTLSFLDHLRFPCGAFPAQQLTKFEGAINSLDIFTSSPNLVEIKCSVRYLAPVPVSVIHHTYLQSFTLTLQRIYGGGNTIDILPHLTLPALRSLHISDTRASTNSETVSSFLDRSTPPVRTLSVNVEGDTYDDWAGCFSRIRDTLENLEVVWPSNTFLDSILLVGLPGSNFHRLPHLQVLTFTKSPDVEHKLMANFIYNRFTSPDLAEIRSFRLTCPPGTFLDDIDKEGVSESRDRSLTILPHRRKTGWIFTSDMRR
ncbi:hypothetical protein B0H19DRAFT_1147728 [Mycena capillaripes]|nr:hypothetical protein B0H19DRAFT_1147728 [Mycena capillaripes]